MYKLCASKYLETYTYIHTYIHVNTYNSQVTSHNSGFNMATATLPVMRQRGIPSLAWIFPLVLLEKPRIGKLLLEAWKKARSPECNSFPFWWLIKKVFGKGKSFPVSPRNFSQLGAGNLQWPYKNDKIFLQCSDTRVCSLPGTKGGGDTLACG